ncbi:MAG: HzsA-related protein, partial [Planctomycetota bacterium]
MTRIILRRTMFVAIASWSAATLAGEAAPDRKADWAVRVLLEFRAGPLRAAVDDMIRSFGDDYPSGADALRRLDRLERRRQQLLASFDPSDPAFRGRAVALAQALDQLRRDALLGNPLMDFDRLLVVKRAYRLPPDKWSKGKVRPVKKAPWSYAERLEGLALGLPVNHNSIFSIPRSGYDNEIAVLSPVRPEGALETVFRPEDDVFVGEVDLDFDGRRMLATMPDRDRWQVFELDVDGSHLKRVTPADEPDVDNYDACYLPDGRIVFCSTASYQSVPCWNGLHNVASLYLLDRASGKIRQLTFDQDDDNYASVLPSGRVLFTRWEYANTPHFFGRLLFSMNPDGTDQKAHYGSNSYWPNAVYYARAVPGHPSKVVGIVSGHHGDYRMGNLVVFDPALGRRGSHGVVFRMPDDWHQHFDVNNRYPEGVPQPLGYDRQGEPVLRDRLTSHDWPKFLHPYPLSENCFLASAKVSPESDWAIYLVDTFGNMTLIRREPGWALLEPIPLKAAARPPAVPDRVDLDRHDGVVYLQDVYAGPGLAGVPRGSVKALRVISYDFGYRGLAGFDKIGIDGPWDVMRILGTVPVKEDGSASFRVPANTPIAVQPLDDRHRALQLMRSWFTVMPGEVRSCVGCHES